MAFRHSSWFIGGSILVSCLALIPIFRKPTVSKPVSFRFASQSWVLPITVKQAVIKYRLQFRPPNIFRTTIGNMGGIFLEFPYYHNADSPFLGEPNGDSLKFHNRIVHTYRFVFPDTLGTYDSLRSVLELDLNQPLVAHQDTIRAPASSRKLMFSKGIVNYEIAQRDDSSYVAIRHQPRQAAYYPAKLQVFFFYGLPYNEIYHRLTVF